MPRVDTRCIHPADTAETRGREAAREHLTWMSEAAAGICRLKCFCLCFCWTFSANPEPRMPWGRAAGSGPRARPEPAGLGAEEAAGHGACVAL